MIGLVFLIAALVLFILAAIPINTGRVNTIAAGLACLTAAMLAPRIS